MNKMSPINKTFMWPTKNLVGSIFAYGNNSEQEGLIFVDRLKFKSGQLVLEHLFVFFLENQLF